MIISSILFLIDRFLIPRFLSLLIGKNWPPLTFKFFKVKSFVTFGAIAQLGERYVRNVEVEGSTPFCSTYFDKNYFNIGRNPDVFLCPSFCSSHSFHYSSFLF